MRVLATPLPAALRSASPWPGLLLGCLIVYALRLASSALSGASLHVDEAQYWDWSRELQWGYYSKPPVIAALMAASTALFGDGETALRALAMACWPLSALLLAALAHDMAQQAGGSAATCDNAGRWAAAIFLASPLATLLGLVATTDAPLLLCWSAALVGLWWALVRGQAWGWAVFALAMGIGLLSKYTAAALLAGAAVLVLLRHRRQARAFALAAGVALLIFSPHLVWNAQVGWPTLRHTAEITVGTPGRLGGGLLDLLGFSAAQALVLAPLVLPAWVWIGWRARAERLRLESPGVGGSSAALPMAWPFLLCTTAPLLLAGLLQAWRSGAQVNWIAPAHAAAAVALALLLAGWPQHRQRQLAWVLLLQAVLLAALVLAPRAASSLGRPWPVLLDPWARMRGWEQALERVAQVLPRDALVVGTSRTVMAQMAWHWRDGLRDRSPDKTFDRVVWPSSPVPGHHYEMRCPLELRHAGPGPVWVLADGPLPADLRLRAGALVQQADVTIARTPGRTLALQLWRATDIAPPAIGPSPQGRCR